LAARPKLVSLALAREAASRNARGIFNLSNVALAGLTGLSEKVVSQIMQDLPARDGTPFERIVTREYIEVAPGITEPRSIAQVRITTPDQSTVSVIRALPAIGGPSDREMQRRAKARANAAASAEAKVAAEVGKRIGWGWCSNHEDADVVIKGHCSACGEVVGEQTMTVEEFGILNPEMRDSGHQPPLSVSVVTLPVEMRDSGPAPTSLLDYAASHPQESPKRCPAPGCRSMEFRRDPSGSWRCLKSGHDPRAYQPFAPSSEWQDVPDGYACPPGVEWRTNLATGASQVRWPEMAAVSGGSE
jgi:hypothetical protein